jgi:purine-nucleoside phosphorylase
MYGYTGFFQGKKVSVQGSGMGMPSIAIYAHELITEYGVKQLIRIGSCGAMQESLRLGDIILAQGACSDSAFNRRRFNGDDFAPIASFELLRKAADIANTSNIPIQVGNILSSDFFYNDPPDAWKKSAKYGVLGVEMESAALYTLAASLQAEALSILTVSDHLVTGDLLEPEIREKGFANMMKLGLDLAVSISS